MDQRVLCGDGQGAYFAVPTDGELPPGDLTLIGLDGVVRNVDAAAAEAWRVTDEQADVLRRQAIAGPMGKVAPLFAAMVQAMSRVGGQADGLKLDALGRRLRDDEEATLQELKDALLHAGNKADDPDVKRLLGELPDALRAALARKRRDRG